MDKQFLKANLGSSLEISISPMKYKKYDIIEVGKVKYMVGSDFVEMDLSKAFEGNNPLDNFNLLFSLMNIVKEPLPKYNNWKSDKMESVIPLKNIEKWVKIYGLPYAEKIDKSIKKDIFNNKDIYNMAKTLSFNMGFNIKKFRYELVKLYFSFKLWHAIKTNNKGDINKYKSLVFLDIKPLEKALTFFLDDDFENNFKIHPVFNKEDNTFKIQVFAHNNLFNAARFQFYNLMTIEDITTNENGNLKLKHMSKCDYCNNYFWSKDSRQKYCNPKCRKKAYYHRNKNN